MYNYNNSPYINNKKRINKYNTSKTRCIQLEKDIFNFINLIRQDPYKYIEIYSQESQSISKYNDNSETEQIIDFINTLSQDNISLPPLTQIQELTKISSELLNYLIKIKKTEGIIKYKNLDEEYLNFRMRAAAFGIIKGKYYEAIVLDSTNLLEIINCIMKDINGRNVLFYEKTKYIGIACGYFEVMNNIDKTNDKVKICTIIDMIQDFEINDLSVNDKNAMDKKMNTRTTEIFKRITTAYRKTNNSLNDIKNNDEKNSFEKTTSNEKIKTYHLAYNDNNCDSSRNKSFEIKKIFINKYPILNYDKKKYPKSPLSKNNQNNSYKNNTLYYSFNNNLIDKKEKSNENLSENNEKNNINKMKGYKKKLNQEEKIELLKHINKISRDKNMNKKTKSNLKIEEDTKSISSNTKRNISNDISLSDLISFDNDKKPKEDNENKTMLKNLLKNQLKDEIKKEIEKEVKEEIKAEILNKVLLTTPNEDIKKVSNDFFFDKNKDIDTNGDCYSTCNFGVLNNSTEEKKG